MLLQFSTQGSYMQYACLPDLPPHVYSTHRLSAAQACGLSHIEEADMGDGS